jgi:hypothetical protein
MNDTRHLGSACPFSPYQRASFPARETARSRCSVARRASAVAMMSSWSPTARTVCASGDEAALVADDERDSGAGGQPQLADVDTGQPGSGRDSHLQQFGVHLR